MTNAPNEHTNNNPEHNYVYGSLASEHEVATGSPFTAQYFRAIIGSNVKRLRTEQNIGKQRFALMVGIGRPTLDHIEEGKVDLRLSYIVRLAEALGVNPYELFVPYSPSKPSESFRAQVMITSTAEFAARLVGGELSNPKGGNADSKTSGN